MVSPARAARSAAPVALAAWPRGRPSGPPGGHHSLRAPAAAGRSAGGCRRAEPGAVLLGPSAGTGVRWRISCDDLLGGAAVQLGLRGGQQPVGQHGHGERLHVVRQRVVPAAQRGGRLRGAQQVQRGARRGAEPRSGWMRVAATRSTA